MDFDEKLKRLKERRTGQPADLDIPINDFQKFYDLLNPKVKKNVEIVTPESLGQNFLLHIDQKTPSYFFPQMPRRAADSEDNTVARITTSPSLLGCIIGYSKLDEDFYRSVKNGCNINKIIFDHALKPNTKLVYDADITDETWLVTYNKQTLRYKPETIGSLFIHSVKIIRNPNRGNSLDHDVIADIFIAIKEDIKILFKSGDNEHFDKNKYFSQGYYKVTMNITTWKEDQMKFANITASEFNKAKEQAAPALEQRYPLFKHW